MRYKTKKAQENCIREALDILETRLKTSAASEQLTSSQAVRQFLQLKMQAFESEKFGVIFLDAQHRCIDFEILFHGTIDGAAVYPREVVKAALKHNAAALIFTHNHPSGFAEPSHADRQITKTLVQACSLLDIRVLDHVIVGASDVVCFAERGYL